MAHETGTCCSRIATTLVLAAVVLASAALGSPARAGVLAEASEEVRTQKRESADHSQDDSCDDTGDDTDSFWIIQALWDLTIGSLTEYLVPAGYWERTNNVNGSVRHTRWYTLPVWDTQFAQFPYGEAVSGIVVVPEEDSVAYLKVFSARVGFDYGNNFDHLQRLGGSAMIEWNSGFAIDAEGHSYHEQTPIGCDRLAVGDFNVLWRYVETKHSVWRIGFGVNWFDDDSHSESGGNLTLRTDFFPAQPVIISGQLDFGSLGAATQFHGRLTAGVNFRRCELFLGYDYRSIGDAELEGPLAGLQFWF